MFEKSLSEDRNYDRNSAMQKEAAFRGSRLPAKRPQKIERCPADHPKKED